MILLQLQSFQGGRKIVQNGQNEQKQGYSLLLVTRRHTKVLREASFVQSVHFATPSF